LRARDRILLGGEKHPQKIQRAPRTLSSPRRPGSPPPELLTQENKMSADLLPIALPCHKRRQTRNRSILLKKRRFAEARPQLNPTPRPEVPVDFADDPNSQNSFSTTHVRIS